MGLKKTSAQAQIISDHLIKTAAVLWGQANAASVSLLGYRKSKLIHCTEINSTEETTENNVPNADKLLILDLKLGPRNTG